MKMEPKGSRPARRHTKADDAYHGRGGMGRGTALMRVGACGLDVKRRPRIVPPITSGSDTNAQMTKTRAIVQKESAFDVP